MPALALHLAPSLARPEDLAGGVAVVIDLLRASTTICFALHAHAAAVRPCEEIDEARRIASELPARMVALGGERGGVKIDGFDLGNSPAEYTEPAVRDRAIVFTTTNGTRALRVAAAADRVLVGCLANLSAVVSAAWATQRPIHLVCAGVLGQPCLDDTLAAGAIAAAVERRAGAPLADDNAILAADLWSRHGTSRTALSAILRRSAGGRNLVGVGLASDIDLCTRIDTAPVVPELHKADWYIRPQ
ncbi:MAG: 2-phosphosulfolactate phosphatase [Phycisphaerae bacterium]|nr:2-phosphosulfolactate phosphatase [Phycisphaerae bacterium]